MMDLTDIKPILVHNQYRPSGSHMKIEQFFDPLGESMQRIRDAEDKNSSEKNEPKGMLKNRINILA